LAPGKFAPGVNLWYNRRMSHSYVRISQSDESPSIALSNLRKAQDILRSQNNHFDANVMSDAYDTLLECIKRADAIVDAIEWNKPVDDAIADYIHFRGYRVQRIIEEEGDDIRE
jgi:hypothetical protein